MAVELRRLLADSEPTFPPELASILMAIMHKASMPWNAFVAPPSLVLLGYGWFIRMNYWPYLDAQLQLRSPDLAGLPDDVIGFGFWMWWPFIALLFTFALMSALSAVERKRSPRGDSRERVRSAECR